MRITSVCFRTLVLATLLAGPSIAAGLEGCPEVPLVAKALRGLQEKSWRGLSVAKVKEMWPTELFGLDCSGDVCSSVESRGRIINGRYECSEIFFFDVTRDQDGAPKTELKNLVIHYSAHQRREVVEAAKLLAGATGLPEAEALSLGRESHQDFHWENTAEGSLSGLSVELRQNAGVFTLTLNLSRYAK